jgi:hypothetical protein
MCIVLSCSYFQLAKNTAKSIIPAALRLRAPQKNFRFAKVGLEVRGNRVGAASVAKQARDALTAARLWQVCEELTHVRFRL